VLWLTGSAPQWIDQRIPLMGLVRAPEMPLAIGASDLDAIMRDELVVALLDIRSPERFKQSQVPGSKWVMPHEVETIETSLGRDRWLILIDSGEGTSRLIAEQLHRSGRTWVAYVEGGFPAWAATRKAS
jgi:rhodanese-related sulfurtransferase